jgi:ubiquinone biosynthesis protein
VVEGVARSFDPRLDIWKTADPVVREWIERNLGPIGRIQGAMSGAGEIGHLLTKLPEIANRAMTVLEQLEDMTREGDLLSPDTIEALGRKEAKKARLSTIALWVIAVASVGILIVLTRL